MSDQRREKGMPKRAPHPQSLLPHPSKSLLTAEKFSKIASHHAIQKSLYSIPTRVSPVTNHIDGMKKEQPVRGNFGLFPARLERTVKPKQFSA
jgi:hypothetical protein